MVVGTRSFHPCFKYSRQGGGNRFALLNDWKEKYWCNEHNEPNKDESIVHNANIIHIIFKGSLNIDLIFICMHNSFHREEKRQRRQAKRWDKETYRETEDRETENIMFHLLLYLKVEITCLYKIIPTLNTLHFTSDDKGK